MPSILLIALNRSNKRDHSLRAHLFLSYHLRKVPGVEPNIRRPNVALYQISFSRFTDNRFGQVVRDQNAHTICIPL